MLFCDAEPVPTLRLGIFGFHKTLPYLIDDGVSMKPPCRGLETPSQHEARISKPGECMRSGGGAQGFFAAKVNRW
jgi:hypothetical protein